MSEEQEGFETTLAARLSDLSETPLATAAPADRVSNAAMRTRSSSVRMSALATAALLAIAAVGVMVAAWPRNIPGQPMQSTASASPAPTAFDAGTLRYECGYRFRFSPSIFEAPDADLEATEAGAALAAFIRRHAHGNILPERGWHLVGSNDSDALYLAAATGADASGIGAYYPEAHLKRDGDRWNVQGFGGCQPKVAVDDLHAATFWLDRHQPVGASASSFEAHVVESGCVGGLSSQDRLRPPLIAYETDRVIIAFTVEPAVAVDSTCVGNPPSLVTVQLAEPIGQRAIVDAGRLPWADVRRGDVTPTATPTASDLEPADADQPVAGACVGPLAGEVVTVELHVDVPVPRCVRVTPNQRLRVANQRTETVSVVIAGTTLVMQSGEATIASPHLGSIWQPGVHVVIANSAKGEARFEVWLTSPG
jgi:hypothetical protein